MSLQALMSRPAGTGFQRFVARSAQFLEHDDGRSFVQLDVADYSGSAVLRCWCDWRDGKFPFSGCDVYEGIMDHRFLDGRLWLDADWLYRAQEDTIHWGGPLLLPRDRVPEAAHSALDRLVGLFTSIEHAPVRTFLGRVFADAAIGPRFVRCRASARHHHCRPGGLLAHSVGVAERCLAASSDLDPSLRDVVVAAALVHDIGKLETVGEGPKRPGLAQWVHHEALTLEILAPHLRWLDSEWAHGAALLRHCVTWYSTKPAGFASFVGADLLRCMDGIDVGIERGKGRGEPRFEPFHGAGRSKAY